MHLSLPLLLCQLSGLEAENKLEWVVPCTQGFVKSGSLTYESSDLSAPNKAFFCNWNITEVFLPLSLSLLDCQATVQSDSFYYRHTTDTH